MSNTSLTIKQNEIGIFREMAVEFSKRNALPQKSPEELFVLMKAGQEMGMGEVESISSLYIVKGKVEIYGKALVAIITREGYQMSYEDESDMGVTVVAKKGDHVIKEVVSADDPILERSNAMKISKKNKMRYHGVRMILNFHLAHLIRSVADIDEVYVQELKDGEYQEVANEPEPLPEVDVKKAKEAVDKCVSEAQLDDAYKALQYNYTMTTEADKVFIAKAASFKKTPNGNQSTPEATPKQREDGLDQAILDGINSAKSVSTLNAIYKDISKEGIDPRPYLPLLNNRKEQLKNEQ